jgi:DNA-binding Lrp family transcriptional regulator
MPGSGERHEELDAQLLTLLRENARTPVSDLATRLGVSRGAVYAAIGRLEQDGIVEGFTVRLGKGHAQRTVRAHVMIKVAPKLSAATQDALAQVQGLAALYAIAGEHDLIAMIEAASLERLNELIDAIGMLDGVERTTSSIILASKVVR